MYDRHQIEHMITALEEDTVSVDKAAEIFGVGDKFFYRLLNRNKFGLKDRKLNTSLFKEARFVREEINELANVYQLQRKTAAKVSD